LDREFEVATDEKVFKGLTQAIEYQDIEATFCAKPTGARNTYSSGKFLVHLVLVFQEMLSCVQWLKFDHDVLY
jgi:hypothetical protein